MLTIIAAVAKNNALGKNNDLIWSLPNDLKRFKKVTSGYHILMGRNTFESIGKPLPNRTSVIITRNNEYLKEGCLIANSVEEAIDLTDKKDAFIIGGAQIYKLYLDKIDEIHLTRVNTVNSGNINFPDLNWLEWKEEIIEKIPSDDSNEYDTTYSILKKLVKK